MWQRLLRLLGTGLNAYSFHSNPVRFIASILALIIIPYTAYIFWGILIIVALAIVGVYFIYKAATADNRSTRYS
jgi:hypothetical protein